jgi:hypothetical protein
MILANSNCEGSSTDTQLCSSPQNLSQNAFVCPGMSLMFTCTTVKSSSLAWISDHYIGEMGAELFFTSGEIGYKKTSPIVSGIIIEVCMYCENVMTKINFYRESMSVLRRTVNEPAMTNLILYMYTMHNNCCTTRNPKINGPL